MKGKFSMNQQQKLNEIEQKLDALTARQLELKKQQTVYTRVFGDSEVT
jgi:hypothetical protein